MHRINLRGPWTLNLQENELTSTRNFHRPPNAKGIDLVILYSSSSPIKKLILNKKVVKTDNELNQPNVTDSPGTAIGRADVTAILEAFNAIQIVWDRWPEELNKAFNNPDDPSDTIRYLPNSSHPLHVDSWLEILE